LTDGILKFFLNTFVLIVFSSVVFLFLCKKNEDSLHNQGKKNIPPKKELALVDIRLDKLIKE